VSSQNPYIQPRNPSPGDEISRLFFANQATALKPFADVLETVSKHYDGWEISAEYRQALPAIKKDFLALTPSYNMKYQAHAPLSDINIASPNPKVRETVVTEVCDCIKTAGELGIGMVTFHPGFISPLTIDDRELAFKLNRESILKIDRLGTECGVKLALENMPRMFQTIGTSFEALKEFIRETEIKVCLDFGHANTAGSLDGFFSEISLLRNIHMHDNRGDVDSHMVPGDGTIDFPKYMKMLKGYAGNFVFEANSIDDGIRGRDRVSGLVALAD
jgi:sugar phosphate isomerase/epimerase